MVVNITYRNKQIDKKINEFIGQPFSLLEKIKMKGIGTSKMQILEANKALEDLFSPHLDTRYCYLELRPKGLIVGFQSVYKTYVWLIPFFYLNIYFNSGLLSIYSKQDFMKMKPPFNGSVDKKYLKKVLIARADYLGKNQFRNLN